ncbi:VOC family protein [Streptomyces sp. NPDC059894]|uniref:VOC family protein n=1 Tax=unclassified Streptomyces TaxID=2593676 RepID=UPI00364D70B0
MASPTFDHLAIGVQRWEDAYPRFAGELGGRWEISGPAGEYAPLQMSFGKSLRLEFIAPDAPDGFMGRFLDRHGPAPHHITFKVPSLDETTSDLSRLQFDTFGRRSVHAVWRESFIHPRNTALGTLVQVVEADEEAIRRGSAGTTPPAGFPEPADSAAGPEVALVGVTTPDLRRAHDLLGPGLLGDVLEAGPGWFFATWGSGRSLLVRDASAAPILPALWGGSTDPGVSFLLFGPPDMSDLPVAELPRRARDLRILPHQSATGIDVWLLG